MENDVIPATAAKGGNTHGVQRARCGRNVYSLLQALRFTSIVFPLEVDAALIGLILASGIKTGVVTPSVPCSMLRCVTIPCKLGTYRVL